MGFKLPVHSSRRPLIKTAIGWADRLGAERLDTDHVLLAMTGMGDELADLLAEHGVTTDRTLESMISVLPEEKRKFVVLEDPTDLLDTDGVLAEAVRSRFGEEALSSDKMWMLTPDEDRAFLLAEMMAERLGQVEIRPAHYLLAYLWSRSSADDVLRRLAVDVIALRDAVVRMLGVDDDVAEILRSGWDRSDAVAAERTARVRESHRLQWVTADTVEAEAQALFERGGTLAVKGVDALDTLWRVGAQAGFALIDNAVIHSTHFWIAAEAERRQAVVFAASVNKSGELAGIGSRDPTVVPPWARVEPYHPLFPVAEMSN